MIKLSYLKHLFKKLLYIKMTYTRASGEYETPAGMIQSSLVVTGR